MFAVACATDGKTAGWLPESYGFLRIHKVNNYYAMAEYQVVWPNAELWRGYYNAGDDGLKWSGWQPIAIATPPQEYDLPLADDYVAGASGAFYSKTQDGIVTITISDVQRADGLGLASGIMATIPVGFRPNRLISVACNFTAAEYNTKVTSGILQALPNGEVWINTTDQSAHAIHGQICYIAGN